MSNGRLLLPCSTRQALHNQQICSTVSHSRRENLKEKGWRIGYFYPEHEPLPRVEEHQRGPLTMTKFYMSPYTGRVYFFDTAVNIELGVSKESDYD